MEEAVRERGHVNILIAGRTGVGKSTLINSMFQGDFATTGQGRPVTQSTREIRKPELPLTLFDTRGLELAAFRETLEELEDVVRLRCTEIDPNKHIHVAWICIAEDSRRVEDAEIALCDMLARHVPVIGVITKSRADNGFRAEVQRLLSHARNVVRVRAIPEEFDDGHSLPVTGLTELVDLTFEVVPEGHQRAFVAAQKASIERKTKSAQSLVAGAAAAAATAAAAPLPFSEAVALIPIHVGMMAGISATFGLSLSSSFLATLITSTMGGTATTIVGRTIVSGLLKLAPGAGSAAGAFVGASTAGALTAGIGNLYVLTLAQLFRDSEGEAPTAATVAAAFRARLQERMAKGE